MTNKYNISIRGRTIIINLNQSNKNHNILRTGGIFHILENDGFTMNLQKCREFKKYEYFPIISKRII